MYPGQSPDHCILFFFSKNIFACHVSGHAIIISIKQYSGMDIFSGNHYFAYGIRVYANPEVIFIDLQGELTK